ncbi:MAG: adenylosuccinate lyase [Methanomassiliicoccales archaeon]
MLLCPLDYRYGRKAMKSIFSEENRLRMQLLVEASLAKAHARVGNIPEDMAKIIVSCATLDCVKLDRVKAIELETKHDIMAMVRALAEACGDAGKYVHLGATSNDIIDTATALQMKEALGIIEKDLVELIEIFTKLAKKHRTTVMVGRTHGQFAVPTTFGFKVAGYLMEMMRHYERLTDIKKRVCVGKMSGAVGTGAALGSKFFEIQEDVMRDLGLEFEEAATQIVCRDRYAELICLMAQICTSCERYATEVRNLQRSEIQEVAEAFDVEKQIGSSTMAQKKNPVVSENICGLARIVRSFVVPSFENMILWHERDLTNSSAERFILPHVLVLTDDILAKTTDVFAHLIVRSDKMKENLEKSKGLIMAEAVMIELVRRGMGRQEAHALVRECSLEAEEKGVHLKKALLSRKEIRSLIDEKELDRVMAPENYLGKAPEIVDRVVKTAEQFLSKLV